MAFTSRQEIFRRLANVASLTQLSPQERRQYDYDLKKARDYYAEMATARIRGEEEGRASGYADGLEQGIEQGIEQGRAEGESQGRLNQSLDIAKNLIGIGMTDEAIAAATNLTIDQVKAIRKNKV